MTTTTTSTKQQRLLYNSPDEITCYYCDYIENEVTTAIKQWHSENSNWACRNRPAAHRQHTVYTYIKQWMWQANENANKIVWNESYREKKKHTECIYILMWSHVFPFKLIISATHRRCTVYAVQLNSVAKRSSDDSNGGQVAKTKYSWMNSETNVLCKQYLHSLTRTPNADEAIKLENKTQAYAPCILSER